MLHITEDQLAALRAVALDAFRERLAARLASMGAAPPDADGLARCAIETGGSRGLVAEADIVAFADVLHVCGGPEREPPWCREIVEGPGARKAERLYAALAAARRARAAGHV